MILDKNVNITQLHNGYYKFVIMNKTSEIIDPIKIVHQIIQEHTNLYYVSDVTGIIHKHEVVVHILDPDTQLLFRLMT